MNDSPMIQATRALIDEYTSHPGPFSDARVAGMIELVARTHNMSMMEASNLVRVPVEAETSSTEFDSGDERRDRLATLLGEARDLIEHYDEAGNEAAEDRRIAIIHLVANVLKVSWMEAQEMIHGTRTQKYPLTRLEEERRDLPSRRARQTSVARAAENIRRRQEASYGTDRSPWSVPVNPAPIQPPTDEHIILVAFHVTGATSRQAQLDLIHELRGMDWEGTNGLEAFWIAMDERYDGSDNDSAEFIEGSGQKFEHSGSVIEERERRAAVNVYNRATDQFIVCRAHRMGHTVAEIAENFEIPESTVRQILIEEGLIPPLVPQNVMPSESEIRARYGPDAGESEIELQASRMQIILGHLAEGSSVQWIADEYNLDVGLVMMIAEVLTQL